MLGLIIIIGALIAIASLIEMAYARADRIAERQLQRRILQYRREVAARNESGIDFEEGGQ